MNSLSCFVSARQALIGDVSCIKHGGQGLWLRKKKKTADAGWLKKHPVLLGFWASAGPRIVPLNLRIFNRLNISLGCLLYQISKIPFLVLVVGNWLTILVKQSFSRLQRSKREGPATSVRSLQRRITFCHTTTLVDTFSILTEDVNLIPVFCDLLVVLGAASWFKVVYRTLYPLMEIPFLQDN